jgi:hypothetical protein
MKHEIRDKPVSTKMKFTKSRSNEKWKKKRQKITDPTKQRTTHIQFYTNTEAKEKKEDLDAVLEAVKFPAGIADLNTSLTNVDWDALSHFRRKWKKI